MSDARGFILFVDSQGWSVAISSTTQERSSSRQKRRLVVSALADADSHARSNSTASAKADLTETTQERRYLIEGSANASPTEAAKLTAEMLKSLGCRAKKVVVALADDACFCASISTEGLSRRGGHRALLYRLEEKLPLAAEEVAFQFLQSGSRALGVGVRRQMLEPILQALEQENFKVVAACPAALLAFQGMQIARGKPFIDGINAVLWQDSSTLHLHSMEKGRLTGWHSMPAERDDLLLALASLLVGRSERLRLACVGVDNALTQSLEVFPEIAILPQPGISSLAASLTATASLLAGSVSPAVDLRTAQDSTHGYPSSQIRVAWLIAAAAALFLLTCVIGSLLYRASQYSEGGTSGPE